MRIRVGRTIPSEGPGVCLLAWLGDHRISASLTARPTPLGFARKYQHYWFFEHQKAAWVLAEQRWLKYQDAVKRSRREDKAWTT